MIADCREIIREASIASNIEEALADQALGQEDERQVSGLLNNALEGAGILKHRPHVEDRTGSDAGAFAR